MLPRPVDREICRMLEERREYPIVDVIAALKIFAQPELLKTDTEQVNLQNLQGVTETQTVVAPVGSQS